MQRRPGERVWLPEKIERSGWERRDRRQGDGPKEDTARQPDSSPHRLPWASPPTQGDAAQGFGLSSHPQMKVNPRKIHTNLKDKASQNTLCPDRGNCYELLWMPWFVPFWWLSRKGRWKEIRGQGCCPLFHGKCQLQITRWPRPDVPSPRHALSQRSCRNVTQSCLPCCLTKALAHPHLLACASPVSLLPLKSLTFLQGLLENYSFPCCFLEWSYSPVPSLALNSGTMSHLNCFSWLLQVQMLSLLN